MGRGQCAASGTGFPPTLSNPPPTCTRGFYGFFLWRGFTFSVRCGVPGRRWCVRCPGRVYCKCGPLPHAYCPCHAAHHRYRRSCCQWRTSYGQLGAGVSRQGTALGMWGCVVHTGNWRRVGLHRCCLSRTLESILRRKRATWYYFFAPITPSIHPTFSLPSGQHT